MRTFLCRLGRAGLAIIEWALPRRYAVVTTESCVDQALFLRPAELAGVEALHATFVKHRYPPHIHEALTLAYVDRGAATFVLEGERYLAPAESVFVIPPQAVHTGESACAEGYTYHVLYLDATVLTQSIGVAEVCFRWRRSSTVMRDSRLIGALANVHQAISRPTSALAQAETLTELMDTLRVRASRWSEPSITERREHRAVGEAKSYIREHWREDFTLTQLASAVELSPSYLCRLFTRQVGMPPSAFRRSLRLEQARRLLRTGEPAVRVAPICGFHDQAHLTRHFKHITGVTPSRYAHPDKPRARRSERAPGRS